MTVSSNHSVASSLSSMSVHIEPATDQVEISQSDRNTVAQSNQNATAAPRTNHDRLLQLRKMVLGEKRDKLVSVILAHPKDIRQPATDFKGRFNNFLKRLEPIYNHNMPLDKIRNSGLNSIESGNQFRSVSNALNRQQITPPLITTVWGSFKSAVALAGAQLKARTAVISALSQHLDKEELKPIANRNLVNEAQIRQGLRVLNNPQTSPEIKANTLQELLPKAQAVIAQRLVGSVRAYAQATQRDATNPEELSSILDDKTLARYNEAVALLTPES